MLILFNKSVKPYMNRGKRDFIAEFNQLPGSESYFGPKYNGTVVHKSLCLSESDVISQSKLNKFLRNYFRKDVVLEQSIKMTRCL